MTLLKGKAILTTVDCLQWIVVHGIGHEVMWIDSYVCFLIVFRIGCRAIWEKDINS